MELYAEIDPAEAVSETRADMVFITLKKMVVGKWPRLLSTVSKVTMATRKFLFELVVSVEALLLLKPYFLKSEYDNINDESSDEEEKAKKRGEMSSKSFFIWVF